LIAQKNYVEAVPLLSQLDDIENLNSSEITFIERNRAVTALNTGNLAQAEKSLERILKFDKLTDQERGSTIELLVTTYNKNHDYQSAINIADAHLAKGGASEKLRLLQVQSNYLAEHFSIAAQQAHTLIDSAISNKQSPNHDLLKMEASCYIKLNDSVGYTNVLMHLVRYYPSTAYWQDLLERIREKTGYSPTSQLDSYRLQIAVGAMQEADDFFEMVNLAMKAGYPAEAGAILAQGETANIFSDAKLKTRFSSISLDANKAQAEDIKLLPKIGEISQFKHGLQAVNNGLNLVFNGRALEGVDLMQRGIDSDSLRLGDEAHLHLAYALYLSGDKAHAKDEFNLLRNANSDAATLAKLWLVHLDASTSNK
jgi:hypothetical protein